MTDNTLYEQSLLKFRRGVNTGDLPYIASIVESTGYFSKAECAVANELAENSARLKEASDYQFLIAESDEIIGFACFGLIPATFHRYDLYWIVVDHHNQGRGLGSLLLRESEAAIATAGGLKIYAETSGRSQYESTRRFYVKNGYEIASILKDFYGDGDDKLTYVKML